METRGHFVDKNGGSGRVATYKPTKSTKPTRERLTFMQRSDTRNLLAMGSVCIALLSAASVAQGASKGTAGQCANANKVNATWTYNWGSSAPSNLPAGVQFYPMWWSYYGASQASDTAALTAIKNAGYNVLLMYNEPDHTDQANLTTAYALQ